MLSTEEALNYSTNDDELTKRICGESMEGLIYWHNNNNNNTHYFLG